jgi:hypothetical protein
MAAAVATPSSRVATTLGLTEFWIERETRGQRVNASLKGGNVGLRHQSVSNDVCDLGELSVTEATSGKCWRSNANT